MYLRGKTLYMAFRLVLSVFFLLTASIAGYAQEDSLANIQPAADSIAPAKKAKEKEAEVIKVEDTSSHKWSPGKRAAVYSAILPGAGQVYNKKYWKVPLVYIAIGIPAYTFSSNLTNFNRSRFAYNYLYKVVNTPNYSNPADSAKIHPIFQNAVQRKDLNALKQYRDGSRRYVDYSALIFILLWGLNVVDAAVDGHLRDFNVSDDLSIQIKPGYMPIGNTTGVGLVLNIGKNHVNRSDSRR